MYFHLNIPEKFCATYADLREWVLSEFESGIGIDYMDSVDLMDRCRDLGIEEGRKVGIKESNRKLVSGMFANGYDLDRICLVTKLSRDEVEQFRESNPV